MVEKVTDNEASARKEPYVFDLPKVNDNRGNLSFLENKKELPFVMQRAYWVYDVPGGQYRGGHAYRTQQEVIIALSGSFDVILHDGEREQTFHLNRSHKALYVPAMTWRALENFSTNSVCLVLSSGTYNEEEYIYNFEEFCRLPKHQTSDNKYNTNIEFATANAQKSKIDDCLLMQLPIVRDRRGSITAVNSLVEVPFELPRIFFVYDIPSGESRGTHAHRYCHQVLIAVSGSFEVVINDGSGERTVTLNRPTQGLHIPPGIWATQQNYSSGAICLVLCSHKYDEQGDYIRQYSDFEIFKLNIKE